MFSKQEARAYILAERKTYTDSEKQQRNEIVLNKIKAHPLFQNSQTVALYFPIQGELDITALTKESAKVFLFPAFVGGELKYVLPKPNTQFIKRFNFFEPADFTVYSEKIDLFLVPCLAVNEHSQRLGYGKGNIDRYFAALNYSADLIHVADRLVSFEAEAHDVKAKDIVTPFKNSALILAAGESLRFGENKALKKLSNLPVFMHSVNTFLKSGFECILVAQSEVIEVFFNSEFKNPAVFTLTGKETRFLSMQVGLNLATGTYVYVHDAARPVILPEDLEQIKTVLETKQGAVLANPIYSSLKNYNGETLDRTNYFTTITPQAFLKTKLKECVSLAKKTDYQDEFELFSEQSEPFTLLLSENKLPKITTMSDFLLTKSCFLKPSLVGSSFDIHPFEKGGELYLAGVLIENGKHFLAVSDGDVVLHSVTEAILGALNSGDLGDNFKETDKINQNRSSFEFLAYALKKANDLNYRVKNADITVMLEQPKLGLKKTLISKALMQALDCPLVSVKATTFEKNGLIGQSQAIGCLATVLLEEKLC